MKKIILSTGFALALLVAATVGVLESEKNDVVLNDLALANVEALANTENGSFYSCDRLCYESSGWNCRIYANGVLVNTCYDYRAIKN